VCAGKLSGLTLARLWNTDSDMAVPRSMQQKVENWTEKIFRRADRLETMMSVLSSVDFDFRVLRREFEGTEESIVIIIVSRKTDQYLSLGVLRDTGDRFMEMFQGLSKGQQEDIFISATEDSFLGHCKGIFEDVFAREREGGGRPPLLRHQTPPRPLTKRRLLPSFTKRISQVIARGRLRSAKRSGGGRTLTKNHTTRMAERRSPHRKQEAATVRSLGLDDGRAFVCGIRTTAS